MNKGEAQKCMFYAQECARLFAQISTGDYSEDGERKRLKRLEEYLYSMLEDVQEACHAEGTGDENQ